ncbi:MAG: hypothetical protein L0Y76_04225, partial [Ignavibacteria bacterium]|nr:hypothetical protein [Ignavibacteria bacterium]
LSAFTPQRAFGQADSILSFYTRNISLTYLHSTSNPVMNPQLIKTEEIKIDNISSVVIKKDVLFIPDENRSLMINDIINMEYSTGKKDYTMSMLIGAGIGLITGILADVIYYNSAHKNPENIAEMLILPSANLAFMVLVPIGTTLTGTLIGVIAAPKKTGKIDMYGGYTVRRTLLINSLRRINVNGI